MAILLFCLFTVLLGGLWVQRRIAREAQELPDLLRLEAGYLNASGYLLPSLRLLPLTQLSWRVVYPDALDTRVRLDVTGSMREELKPQRRFYTESLIREFTLTDVLGFCRYRWQLQDDSTVLTLPALSQLRQLPALRSFTAEDGFPDPLGEPQGDRMEIRPYAPGDSSRDIMWRSYAKTRQLNVRLAEKSVFQSKRVLAYLLASDQDEAAAACARQALQSGALGDDWLFGADNVQQTSQDLAAALTILARSRPLSGSNQYGLDQFLASAGFGSAPCLVFAAAERAPWIPALLATARSSTNRITLVLATDGFDESQKPGFWARLMLRDQPNEHSGLSRRELGALLTDLGQSVESIVLMDRQTGAAFDQQLRRIS